MIADRPDRPDQVQACIEFSRLWRRIKELYLKNLQVTKLSSVKKSNKS